MAPVFLRLDEVLLIHRDQIERYGGRPGIRDLGLLQSALAVPEAGIRDRYLHEDLFEMAAAYLFHLVRDHPFVDGNKRVGAVAALVFLSLNGVVMEPTERQLEKIVRAVAEGTADKGKVTAFFRRHACE